MKTRNLPISIVIFLLAFSTVSPAQMLEDGWLGIRPLISTRDDVEKKLGRPEIDENGYHGFRHDGTFIQVDYAVGPCQPDRRGRGSLNVPKDTVLRYHVWFKQGLKLSDLKWSKDRYQKEVDPHAWNQVIYVDYKEGISIKVGLRDDGEYVANIVFTPSEALRTKFECPDPMGNTQPGSATSSQDAIEKGWKGIRPLKSTKQDVEKVVGERMPWSVARHSATYKTTGGIVSVLYSSGKCDGSSPSWQVPEFTVVRIDFSPDYPNPHKFTDLKLSLDKFEKRLDPGSVHLVFYTSEVNGVSLTVDSSDDTVRNFGYFPEAKFDRLKCKNK
jgi:hypothetical protein